MGAQASTAIACDMFEQQKRRPFPTHFEFDYNRKFVKNVSDEGITLMPGGFLAPVPEPVHQIGDGLGVAGHIRIVESDPAPSKPTLFPFNSSPANPSFPPEFMTKSSGGTIDTNKSPPSGCPMHQLPQKQSVTESDKQTSPAASYPSECPMSQSSQVQLPSDCPMSRGEQTSSSTDEINKDNMMPAPNQRPAPDQPFPLSTDRIKSTIPKAGTEETWVYPSPQMFWNAMLRKGWRWKEDDLNQKDMDHIINIHNANNELAWREVLKWEALHADECAEPKLKRFSGAATKFSPRARFRSWLGYELPFDRHDWVVDRNGKEVRYVIDYYDGGKLNKDYEFALLDVRPAFDSLEAIMDRMKVCIWRWKSEYLPSDASSSAAPEHVKSTTSQVEIGKDADQKADAKKVWDK